MKASKKEGLIALAAVLAIGLFYVVTIRGGHAWGDDFAGYLLHARSIIEGKSYQDTDYVYNPFNAKLGPRMYPPVLPLLLTPVLGTFGLNILAFKIELIVIFGLLLLVLFLLFKEDLGFPSALLVIVIIGLNPCFWEYKDDILSEIPFLFFVYLGLFLIDRAHRHDRFLAAPVVRSLIITAVIVFAVGTRIIGIALIPCAFILEYFRHRKTRKSALALALPLAVVVLLLVATGFGFVRSYFDQFTIRPSAILRNAFNYLKIMGALWTNAHSKALHYLMFLASIGFALVGYLRRVKARLTVLELFPVIYFLCLIFWPGYISFRGMMPIVPLFVFYAIIGAGAITMPSRNPAVRPPLVAFVGLIFLSYAGFYVKMDVRPLAEGVETEGSRELFQFIKGNSQKDDVFVFRKPRALALFTGRKASVYFRPDDDRALWDYFMSIKARYVIVGRPFRSDLVFLRPFLERHRDRVQSVFANADFEVYRITANP